MTEDRKSLKIKSAEELNVVSPPSMVTRSGQNLNSNKYKADIPTRVIRYNHNQLYPGLDRKRHVLLKKGKLSPEKTIDLHGLSTKRAEEEVLAFLFQSYSQGLRLVLVITGKGRNSIQKVSNSVHQTNDIGIIKKSLTSWIKNSDIMPLILPKQKSYKSLFSRDARQFLAEIEIEPNSKLLGVNLKENSIKELANSNILFVQRGEHAFYPPLEKLSLRVGDIIVLAATRKSLERAMQELGDQIHPHLTKEPGDKLEDAGEYLSKDARVLAEVLIAPRSEMIGKDLEQIRFRNFTSCIVLGLLRRSRMLKDRITEIPLLAGDVLLVQGSEIGISNLKQNSDVVLIDFGIANQSE